MSWEEEAAAYLRSHEGSRSFFYCDIVGLVTVGVGCMIPTAAAAAALSMVNRLGEQASSAELGLEWGTIKAVGQPATAVSDPSTAHTAEYYKQFCSLTMPDEEIQRLLLGKLDQFAGSLISRFPAFDTFPSKACVGLADMIYSLGPSGLYRGFPTFCAAVDRKDWKTCAVESHRQKVSASRNADLKALFENAAQGAS